MATIVNLFCGTDKIKTMNHTPGTLLAVDEIRLINGRVCVAFGDIAASEEGSVIYAAEDIEAPKAAVAITEGETAYWDDTAKLFTNVLTSNTKCGIFRKAALSGDANARLELDNSVNL